MIDMKKRTDEQNSRKKRENAVERAEFVQATAAKAIVLIRLLARQPSFSYIEGLARAQRARYWSVDLFWSALVSCHC